MGSVVARKQRWVGSVVSRKKRWNGVCSYKETEMDWGL